MKFTLRQLEVFVAVAQQESVSRAAEGLSLSQSATSTSLGELERQFDCKLFDRAGKRLTLNALGRQLLPQAVALLDRGEEIENLLNGKTAFGSLDLGATLTIGNYLATLLIGAFMQRQPDCRVRLHVHNTAQVVQQVAHYELDLGLIEGDCRHPDIEVQPWMEDVESGLGIGCISRLALRDAFRRGSLVPVETPGLDLRRQFYFIWHKQKYQTATMREFLDLCRSETAGISRSDEIVLPLIP